MLVMGLFPMTSDAEQCLDNLAEADFGSTAISLVMRSKADVEKIARVSGPLTGLSVEDLSKELSGLGVSPLGIGEYAIGVLTGGVFIAIAADDADAASAAAEMLKDGNAREIRTLTRA